MNNHHRHHWLYGQWGRSITCVLLTYFLLAILPLPLSLRCNAHFVPPLEQHHVLSPRNYPRPHFPPPVYLSEHVKAKELTPAECMVDLTNELTYRILHYHSILNRNNFAFSPTALMSVLVALYEGSTGHSATELNNVLQFPNNRDIVRVGYRDIHRRLRTYFFGSDNPLKGLSLNRENVTITRDFEAILTFYGYDLGIDMVSSTSSPTTTATTSSTKVFPSSTVEVTTVNATTVDEVSNDTTHIIEETTTTTPTTSMTTTASTTETTAAATKISLDTTTNTSEKSSDDTTLNTTPPAATDDINNETTTTVQSDIEENTTGSTVETTAASTVAIETSTNEAVELISSFVAEETSAQLQRIQKAKITRLPSAKLQAPVIAKPPHINYLPSLRKSQRQFTNRSKRHLVGFKELDTKFLVSLLNTESLLHPIPSSFASYNAPLTSYAPGSNEFEVDTEPNFIHTSSAAIKQNYNTDVITHLFYLSNQQIIYTSFKVYNAVLYYKYFDQLRMSVLELELDTPDYNLIILLPDYDTDLVTAAASLRTGPKLRLLRKQLKPKWVQAIIPDFKLHGTMFLTNDLQNMGICDIFEPNRADFRPMTDEKGTYVKHIEQSININIRTHPINQIRRNNGAQAQPIQISVNHPFLFFIIDRDLDVAVMSGRVLNPLNVRIQ